jgi:hypothetical protein
MASKEKTSGVVTEERLKSTPASFGVVIVLGLGLLTLLGVVYNQVHDVEKKVNDLSTAVAASSATIVTRLDALQERLTQANADIDKIAPRPTLATPQPPASAAAPAIINVPTQVVPANSTR